MDSGTEALLFGAVLAAIHVFCHYVFAPFINWLQSRPHAKRRLPR